jgi:hypothetical protein
MASRTTDSEGGPPTERAPRAGIDSGRPYATRLRRTPRPGSTPYPGWGILVIGSEEKTVIRGSGLLLRTLPDLPLVDQADTFVQQHQLALVVLL